MDFSRLSSRAAGLAGALAAYVVAGKLGLALAFLHPSASPVWPATGVALATLLLLGLRAWPVIFLGALVVNITGAAGTAVSAGIATGNTIEAVLGASLVQRYAGGLPVFRHARAVFLFILLAAMIATAVGATIGVTSLAVGGEAAWPEYGAIWVTWWLGDAVGALVVTPVVLLWSVFRGPGLWSRGRLLEAAALLAGALIAADVVFGDAPLFPSAGQYPVAYLVMPFFIWAAFRFGPGAAAGLVAVVAVVAVHGTLLGRGPFGRANPNESLLLLQLFVGVAAATTMALAAVVDQHRRAAARLRDQAMTDALTGLANYRKLMSVLETEIERSGRTGRPFSVLFLDVDGLKRLNDHFGHLVGSRALCRVADAIGRSCRGLDTPARFGGDEFAIALPEASEVAALTVAGRVRHLLASSGENPAVTVSIGVAEYPRDAATVGALMASADRRLYQDKAARVSQGR